MPTKSKLRRDTRTPKSKKSTDSLQTTASDQESLTYNGSGETEDDSGYDADSDPDDSTDSEDDDDFYGLKEAVCDDGDVKMNDVDYYGSDTEKSP